MAKLLIELAKLETSMLADANKAIRAVDPEIRPVRPPVRTVVGRARTVSCRNDFLTVMRALADAVAGEFLVIDGRGGRLALAGEMFALEARRKKLAGIIVDGAIRDSAAIADIGLPVYSRFINPVAGTIEKIGQVQVPVTCGGILVAPGDLLVADADGIVCGSEDELAALLPTAQMVSANEARAFKAFNSGTGLMDMLNFEDHYAACSDGRPSELKYTL